MIRPASLSDAAAICGIYNHYVVNTPITFEEETVSVDEMAERIRDTVSALPWLVYEEGGTILGYAYASKWKSRCAYRYSAESTIYLRVDQVRHGTGTRLYTELLAELKQKGL